MTAPAHPAAPLAAPAAPGRAADPIASGSATRDLRVLIDVAQFGVVQDNLHHTQNRAGIFRVIEETVRSVRATPGVRLALCAREWTSQAMTFVAEHDEFRTLPFAPARKHLEWRLRNGAERLGGAGLPMRAAGALAGRVNRYFDRRSGPLGPGRLLDADIYHSPVYALPPIEQRPRKLRYVLTIYDVIPFVFTDFSSWGGGEWLRRIVDSIRPDDHVLAISEHTRNDLLHYCPHVRPEHVHVTPLAADTSRFYRCEDPARIEATRARYGIPDAPYVLSVGTLEPRKNIPHLIQAFADLVRAERLDDLHLVLTGSKGWDYDAIFAAAGQFEDLRDRIVFTGYVADADMAPLYTDALVFVYPTFYEGFGLPPLEAMQCGTPVITSDTSSLPEVVGDAGIMVDPRDRAALAQAILDVYRDTTLRDEMSRRSLARAGEFTWTRYARQVVDAYRAAREMTR